MKFLISGGGTAGHINPAIAMGKFIRARRPDDDIVFAGAKGGMEETLVTREGFRLETIAITGIHRSLSPKAVAANIRSIGRLAGSVGRARELIRSYKPDVVVGTGGYACFPILYAAAKIGIPTVLHESNALPGRTARLLGRYADKILLGFEDAAAYFKHKDRIVLTGNPVREDMLMSRKDEARRELGIPDDKKLIVSAFGSLGAREMNRMAADMFVFEQNDDEIMHIHSTGAFGWKWMPELLREKGLQTETPGRLSVREYINDMPRVLAAADLMICRAGAMTMTELCVTGTPAIIIPSPNVADNHQEKNARALSDRGAAVTVREKDCSAKVLYGIAAEILRDRQKLRSMSANASGMAILDSADRIYDEIINCARKT